MNDKIRVAILEDHPAIIEGYLARLRENPQIEVVGTAGRGEALEQLLAACPAQVLILDLGVPISDNNPSPYPVLLVIPRLLETYPDLKILVISMYEQVALIQAVVEAGARGYILKDDRAFMKDLPAIVETVAHGGSYFSSKAHEMLFRPHSKGPLLSQRQLQGLSLCAAYPHESTMKMAERLGVASSTMRNLLSSAYLVLDVHSRAAAVARAQQLGYLLGDPRVDMKALGGASSEK